jgi:hypothetical protein
MSTVSQHHDLIGQHFEGDRWLHRDDDFYYLYSTWEPEIWIAQISEFDKWGNSTDFVVLLWHWQVSFEILAEVCQDYLDSWSCIADGSRVDVTQNYLDRTKVLA